MVSELASSSKSPKRAVPESFTALSPYKTLPGGNPGSEERANTIPLTSRFDSEPSVSVSKLERQYRLDLKAQRTVRTCNAVDPESGCYFSVVSLVERETDSSISCAGTASNPGTPPIHLSGNPEVAYYSRHYSSFRGRCKWCYLDSAASASDTASKMFMRSSSVIHGLRRRGRRGASSGKMRASASAISCLVDAG